MAGQPIHIALTFDDGYWAPAYAVMRSIAFASRRPGDLVFHLFHIGLAAHHRQALDAIAAEFPVRLEHVDLAAEPAYREFVARLPIRRPFTPVIYARLLLASLLPAEVDRLVYLDCDVLVRAPIEELAATDLSQKSIGAVLDPYRHMQMLGRDLTGNGTTFDYNFPYFNSGVLLIDRARYAAADPAGRTAEMAASGLLDRLQYDQAALNLVFRDDWAPLDFRWNVIGATPAHEALEPFVIHYTGPRKPWSLVPGAAHQRLYRHVMTNAVYYAFWRERLQRRLLRPFRH
jgi:lipopolysaccharide biosynthesis glycosyltransferase